MKYYTETAIRATPGTFGRSGPDWLKTFQNWDRCRNSTGITICPKVRSLVARQDFIGNGLPSHDLALVYGTFSSFSELMDFVIACGLRMPYSLEYAFNLRCFFSDQDLRKMGLKCLVVASPIPGTEKLLALSSHSGQCRLEFYKQSLTRAIPKTTGFAFVL